MKTCSDDSAQLVGHLDRCNIGHPSGAAKVARQIDRHGTGRMNKAVRVDPIPPMLLKTKANALNLQIKSFDGIQAGGRAPGSHLFMDQSMLFRG